MSNQDVESRPVANRFDTLKPGALNRAEKDTVIKLALSVLADRHRAGRALSSPEQTRDFLRLKLVDRKHEVFGALFLDNRHRVIRVAEMFQGTIDGASVHPRGSPSRVMLTRRSPGGCGTRWRWWTYGCSTTSSSPPARA